MPDVPQTHERFMREALGEATLAVQTGDVPVGAVVVVEGVVVGRGRNQREATPDPTAHAEVLALRDAAGRLGSWRLTEATLYVTLEPCIMCVGAAVLSRLACLVFGCRDAKAGACGSQFDILSSGRLNHLFPVVAGVCQAEASALLSGFFRQLRQQERERTRGVAGEVRRRDGRVVEGG